MADEETTTIYIVAGNFSCKIGTLSLSYPAKMCEPIKTQMYYPKNLQLPMQKNEIRFGKFASSKRYKGFVKISKLRNELDEWQYGEYLQQFLHHLCYDYARVAPEECHFVYVDTNMRDSNLDLVAQALLSAEQVQAKSLTLVHEETLCAHTMKHAHDIDSCVIVHLGMHESRFRVVENLCHLLYRDMTCKYGFDWIADRAMYWSIERKKDWSGYNTTLRRCMSHLLRHRYNPQAHYNCEVSEILPEVISACQDWVSMIADTLEINYKGIQNVVIYSNYTFPETYVQFYCYVKYYYSVPMLKSRMPACNVYECHFSQVTEYMFSFVPSNPANNAEKFAKHGATSLCAYYHPRNHVQIFLKYPIRVFTDVQVAFY